MRNFIILLFGMGMVLFSCKKLFKQLDKSYGRGVHSGFRTMNGMVAGNDSAFRIQDYAGSGTAGSSNGTAGNPETAQFDAPEGIVFDSHGSMFIADRHNEVIRKITSDGVVSVFAGKLGVAGGANGKTTIATFDGPIRLAIDNSDNLYVSDRDDGRIRKITPDSIVSTIAGSTPGSGASQFNWPLDLAVTSDGNTVYVADSKNNRIQKLTRSGSTYTVSLLAGQLTAGYSNGTGSAARFNAPSGLSIDNAGNIIVADRNNHCIRKITPTGTVSLLAGIPGTSYDLDAPALKATFGQPYGVTVANDGSIYIADIGYHTIRRLSNGFVATVAGSGSAGSANGDYSSFNTPTSIAIDAAGDFYVADLNNNKIRKMVPVIRDLQYTEGWGQSDPFPGVTWYWFHGNRFWLPSAQTNKNQYVNVLDVDLTVNHLNFKHVEYAHDTTVTAIVGAPTATIAALSGTFATGFIYSDSLRHYASYLRNNDTTYWAANVSETNRYWVYHEGIFYVNADGAFGMERSNMAESPYNPTLHKYMISGAPVLIYNGDPIEITDSASNAWPNDPPQNLRIIIAARSAIAIPVSDHHMLLICVDGIERGEDNKPIHDSSCYNPPATGYGMTTKDLTQFIRQYFNAPFALNLDGGGSASMCLMGHGDNHNIPGGIGVIGHPDWDGYCQLIPGGDISPYGQQRMTMQDAIEVIPN